MRSSSPWRTRPGRAAWIFFLATPFSLLLLSRAEPEPMPPMLQDPPRIIAWNDLGMHCIDPDFSIFSILPPYNTINAQVVLNGQLVQSGQGVTVTYEAVADANGSINSTSIGKTNFWQYVQALFGVSLAPDVGLAGNAMPGLANVPQPSHFDGTWNWFQAEGIPLTPTDDALAKNPYPLMRLVARNASGQQLAETVTTAPNSAELNCNRCHESGGNPAVRPQAGWVYDPNPIRDDRLNILRLHDDRHLGSPQFGALLTQVGYDTNGLYATAMAGTPIFCARCHGSNALPGSGVPSVTPMTQAMHLTHGGALDEMGQPLAGTGNRTACYFCHPGTDTKCLRGAMGHAIGSDGKFSMHCQDCHGDFADVGRPGRTGWLDQATCQNCHTGTATQNSGEIRYTSVFDQNGAHRTPASNAFATTPNVPAAGFSLYRFSEGHGDLQCSACHGSPHAIYPTSEDNDNEQSMRLQGHVGTIMDCNVCHEQREDNQTVGPHGMHPVDANWASGQHGDIVERVGSAHCQSCHGSNYRGTVLSLAQGDRSYTTRYGTKTYFRKAQVSCYGCHDGPNSENTTRNHAPVVVDQQLQVANDQTVNLTLTGNDADGDSLTFRVVSQPRVGTVGWNGATVTYFPEAGFTGQATFTYAAWDGKSDSNLGTVTVTVGPPACAGSAVPYGFGCDGSGYHWPQLRLSGCPTPGDTVAIEISEGLGGGSVYLAIGATRGLFELVDGCMLRVAPLVTTLGPFTLSGSGPGQGTLHLPVSIPLATPTGSFTMQAAILDPGTARGFASTNALEIAVR